MWTKNQGVPERIIGDMQFRIHMKFRLPYDPLCNEFSYTPENSSTNM